MKLITKTSIRNALMEISLKSWEGADFVPTITSTEGYPFWWDMKIEKNQTTFGF